MRTAAVMTLFMNSRRIHGERDATLSLDYPFRFE
jgi:hypothetical protein